MKSYLKHLLIYIIVFLVMFSLSIFYNMYTADAVNLSTYLAELQDRFKFIIPISVALAFVADRREKKKAKKAALENQS